MPPQLEKNHVVPTAWQDEALARDGEVFVGGRRETLVFLAYNQGHSPRVDLGLWLGMVKVLAISAVSGDPHGQALLLSSPLCS